MSSANRVEDSRMPNLIPQLQLSDNNLMNSMIPLASMYSPKPKQRQVSAFENSDEADYSPITQTDNTPEQRSYRLSKKPSFDNQVVTKQ